jgi:hypothetical protein
LQGPTHYRTTFLTIRPPGALEQLLAQLKARWVSVRQSTTSGTQRGQSSGQQLTIDGYIFAIGSDWLVRVGNVVLAGGAVKGMLLEVSRHLRFLMVNLYILHHRLSIFHFLRSIHQLRTEPQSFSQTC